MGHSSAPAFDVFVRNTRPSLVSGLARIIGNPAEGDPIVDHGVRLAGVIELEGDREGDGVADDHISSAFGSLP